MTRTINNFWRKVVSTMKRIERPTTVRRRQVDGHGGQNRLRVPSKKLGPEVAEVQVSCSVQLGVC